jgi:hypothetical protein
MRMAAAHAAVESSRVVYDDGDNGPVVDVGAVTA